MTRRDLTDIQRIHIRDIQPTYIGMFQLGEVVDIEVGHDAEVVSGCCQFFFDQLCARLAPAAIVKVAIASTLIIKDRIMKAPVTDGTLASLELA